MAHLHSIYDSDLHFVIDPVTRVITNQSENKNSVIQFDHNSERFTFELPRYIEEHDMLRCNRVEVHYVNIDSKTGNQSNGVYDVQDLQVSPHDEKVAICSWLVSNNATQYAGSLSFVIRFACTSGDVVDYVWNTAVFKNYAVQNGLYNSDPIVAQYPDVLAQWYDSLFTASADGVTNIQEARAAAITAVDAVADERIADIEQTGRDVVDSLPDDYVALTENVAPAIVETATGSAIAIRDSADRKLRGLTLYGKSTQDGTPTPEAPVEIESVENPTVTVCGVNLIQNELVSRTIGGVTFTTNDDGSVTANGTSTELVQAIVSREFLFQAGVRYKLTGCPYGGGKESYRIDNTDKLADDGNGGFAEYETDTVFPIRIRIAAGVTVTNLTFFPMLCFTSIEDTIYEPYTEQTLPVTRTLPGIPVTSGGNYTDENGQQWVCDEVDFGRGVYVQRTEEKKLTGTEYFEDFVANYGTVTLAIPHKLDSEFLCSHTLQSSSLTWSNSSRMGFRVSLFGVSSLADFKDKIASYHSAGNPVTLLYAIPTPIETALTAEELAAYASLRSNYPNTSVLNDGGAGMAVAYVADTKRYIDKKLSV